MGKLLNIIIISTVLIASAQLLAANGSVVYNASPNNGANFFTTNPYAVNVMYNSSVGNYLVGYNGYTLYMYTHDKAFSGNSSCYGSCSYVWPVYYNENMYYPPSLPSYNFGVINRTDGTKQLTYKGYPLYVYIGDSSPGQINGNGENGFYVMTSSGPYTPPPLPANSTASQQNSNTSAVGIAGNIQRSSSNSSNNSSTTVAPTATTTSSTTAAQSSSTTGSNNYPFYIGLVVVVLVVLGLAYFFMRKH